MVKFGLVYFSLHSTLIHKVTLRLIKDEASKPHQANIEADNKSVLIQYDKLYFNQAPKNRPITDFMWILQAKNLKKDTRIIIVLKLALKQFYICKLIRKDMVAN